MISLNQLINHTPGGKYTTRHIFEDNHNWDVYCFLNRDILRDVEVREVNEMLTCKDSNRGFYIYHCDNCNETHFMSFGCNSRICSNCGKNYTDKWAEKLSKKMFNVPHRHIVLTLSDRLRPYLLEDRSLWKVIMDAAIAAINSMFTYCQGRKITAGAIVVFHPFARDLGFNPHVHVLVTEGGFDGKGRFIHQYFLPAKAMRKTWQYHVLTRLKKALPNTVAITTMIDRLFKIYDEGFYVYLPKETRIRSKREIAKYVARYVRHPAIANSRICGYDGKTVTFWYIDQEDKKQYRTMEVHEFIGALVQHIPDVQFKMIRYYGAYSRRLKGKYARRLGYVSIAQEKLDDYPSGRRYRCPKCGSFMTFVEYWKDPPDRNAIFGEKINDWSYICPN
jgi:uncharacterized protein (DUF983 family)